MSVRVGILGGGMAGVSVAKELALAPGYDPVIVEGEPALGGLQYSAEVDGLMYDIGAFLFTPDHPVFKSFPFLLPHFKSVRHSAISITPSGRPDRYPCTMRGFVRDNGVGVALTCAAEILVARARHDPHGSVADYARYHLGDTFYQRSGLQHYIERLYALPQDEIGIEFAEQRLVSIKKYTPSGVLRRRLDAAMRRLRGQPPITTMVRPAEGFGAVYGMIRRDLESLGTEIHLGSPVRGVRRAGDEFVIATEAGEHVVDRVVSTIPVPAMLGLLGLPAEGFDYMHLVSLFCRANLGHDAWLQCNFTHEGDWKKLTAFSKCYGMEGGRDYFTVEMTTREPSDELRDRFYEDFTAHARRLGVVEGDVEMAGSRITRDAYPVFHREGGAAIAAGRARLREAGIEFVGRQGNFEYSSSGVVAGRARSFATRFR